jgi:hypothetical protein
MSLKEPTSIALSLITGFGQSSRKDGGQMPGKCRANAGQMSGKCESQKKTLHFGEKILNKKLASSKKAGTKKS